MIGTDSEVVHYIYSLNCKWLIGHGVKYCRICKYNLLSIPETSRLARYLSRSDFDILRREPCGSIFPEFVRYRIPRSIGSCFILKISTSDTVLFEIIFRLKIYIAIPKKRKESIFFRISRTSDFVFILPVVASGINISECIRIIC